MEWIGVRIPALLGAILCFHVLSSVFIAEAKPVRGRSGPHGPNRKPAPMMPKNKEKTWKFMRKYGYIDETTSERDFARKYDNGDMYYEIYTLQKFMGFTPTGEVDDITLGRMESPRCGFPDKGTSLHRSTGERSEVTEDRKKRYILDGGRWEQDVITYRIVNSPKQMTLEEIRPVIRQSFDVWEEHIPRVLQEVTSGDADIYLSFETLDHGDAFPFDGPGGTYAHAFGPQISEWGDLAGDVHFDDSEDINLYSYEGINLHLVASHEIGHSLGLGHSDVFGSLMWPYYGQFNWNGILSYDDKLGIDAIYLTDDISDIHESASESSESSLGSGRDKSNRENEPSSSMLVEVSSAESSPGEQQKSSLEEENGPSAYEPSVDVTSLESDVTSSDTTSSQDAASSGRDVISSALESGTGSSDEWPTGSESANRLESEGTGQSEYESSLDMTSLESDVTSSDTTSSELIASSDPHAVSPALESGGSDGSPTGGESFLVEQSEGNGSSEYEPSVELGSLESDATSSDTSVDPEGTSEYVPSSDVELPHALSSADETSVLTSSSIDMLSIVNVESCDLMRSHTSILQPDVLPEGPSQSEYVPSTADELSHQSTSSDETSEDVATSEYIPSSDEPTSSIESDANSDGTSPSEYEPSSDATLPGESSDAISSVVLSHSEGSDVSQSDYERQVDSTGPKNDRRGNLGRPTRRHKEKSSSRRNGGPLNTRRKNTPVQRPRGRPTNQRLRPRY